MTGYPWRNRIVSGREVLSAGLRGLGVPSLGKGVWMAESVYKVIELVGSSTESWEKAAEAAVKQAASAATGNVGGSRPPL